MDILDRFKRSEPLDAAGMVFEAIQTREHWEDELQWLQHNDPKDRGKPGVGDDESLQVPYPADHVEALRAATARLAGTMEEVRQDHPVIWALWAKGKTEANSAAFASMLGSLGGQRSREVFSDNRWFGYGSVPAEGNGFSRWTEPVGGSLDRFRLIVGNDAPEFTLSRVKGCYELELISGDPLEAKALIEAGLAAADDPERRKRLETTLDEIAAELKSALDEGEQALQAMSAVFQEGERLYLKAQSEEQEDRERPYREDAQEQIDSLI